MLVEKWLLVVWLIISYREGYGKVVYGIVSSSGAYQDSGAYITKFCYHSTFGLCVPYSAHREQLSTDQYAVTIVIGGTGRFWYKLNDTTDGAFYLFLDEQWPQAEVDNCSNKLAKARLRGTIYVIEESQVCELLMQWVWIRYKVNNPCQSDPSRTIGTQCMQNLDHVMPVHHQKTIIFLMNFIFIILITMATPQIILELNKQVSSNTLHCVRSLSCYVGLQTCYNLFVLLYLLIIILWGQKVWQIISKGGPMHSVLKMLSITVITEFISSLLMALYYWRSVSRGVGVACGMG